MFGTSWHIGRIFGIPLRIHISWFLVFALVVWSLARYYFPAVLSQSPPWEYWVLGVRSEEHTSELQSHSDLVCRLLLEKKKKKNMSVVISTNRELTGNIRHAHFE